MFQVIRPGMRTWNPGLSPEPVAFPVNPLPGCVGNSESDLVEEPGPENFLGNCLPPHSVLHHFMLSGDRL